MTARSKTSDALSPPPSRAITRRLVTPAAPGVPLKVRVPASKLSQAGNALPSALLTT